MIPTWIPTRIAKIFSLLFAVYVAVEADGNLRAEFRHGHLVNAPFKPKVTERFKYKHFKPCEDVRRTGDIELPKPNTYIITDQNKLSCEVAKAGKIVCTRALEKKTVQVDNQDEEHNWQYQIDIQQCKKLAKTASASENFVGPKQYENDGAPIKVDHVCFTDKKDGDMYNHFVWECLPGAADCPPWCGQAALAAEKDEGKPKVKKVQGW